MNVSSESLSLSKHLMLFLVASFAFSMKELLMDPSPLVVGLLIAALAAAFVSFSLGYVVIFEMLEVESTNPAREDSAPLPRTVKTRLRWQYVVTMVALALMVLSLGVRLWVAVKPGPA